MRSWEAQADQALLALPGFPAGNLLWLAHIGVWMGSTMPAPFREAGRMSFTQEAPLHGFAQGVAFPAQDSLAWVPCVYPGILHPISCLPYKLGFGRSGVSAACRGTLLPTWMPGIGLLWDQLHTVEDEARCGRLLSHAVLHSWDYGRT